MPIRFQSVRQRLQASLPSLPNKSPTASRLKRHQRKTVKTESSQKARFMNAEVPPVLHKVKNSKNTHLGVGLNILIRWKI